jgi:hypothetical protein
VLDSLFYQDNEKIKNNYFADMENDLKKEDLKMCKQNLNKIMLRKGLYD